jgi:hypothetical protein
MLKKIDWTHTVKDALGYHVSSDFNWVSEDAAFAFPIKLELQLRSVALLM